MSEQTEHSNFYIHILQELKLYLSIQNLKYNVKSVCIYLILVGIQCQMIQAFLGI